MPEVKKYSVLDTEQKMMVAEFLRMNKDESWAYRSSAELAEMVNAGGKDRGWDFTVNGSNIDTIRKFKSVRLTRKYYSTGSEQKANPGLFDKPNGNGMKLPLYMNLVQTVNSLAAGIQEHGGRLQALESTLNKLLADLGSARRVAS